MKTTNRFLTIGLMMAAFVAVSIVPVFAQATADECDAIYNQKFLANRTGPDVAKFEIAIAAGNEYLQKCKDLVGNDDVKDYVTKQLPKITSKRDAAKFQRDVVDPLNTAIQGKNWDGAFNYGKQYIAATPDDVDVRLILASIGFDRTVEATPNDKFNGDTIAIAQQVIQKLNENKPSSTGDYGAGAYGYVYKTKTCPDGRLNALGWMDFTIGNITYYRLKNMKDAAPYLYKSVQVGCETKTFADAYRMIGSWYLDEAIKINKLLETAKEETEETKAQAALRNGYSERALDAYVRAAKVASAPGSTAKVEFKNALNTKVNDLYKFRFNKTDGQAEYVAAVSTKPFIDPTVPVTPIIDASAATTGTASPTSTPTASGSAGDSRPRTATTPATSTGKPATATPATPATSTGKPATVTPATTTKAPAKTPAPKKKGTR